MGLPEDRKPQWIKVSSGAGAKAHLRNPAALQMTSWCGISMDSAVDGTYEERCKPCLKAFREFFAEVELAPPDTITERFVLTVTRPATGEPVMAGVQRSFASRRSWDWNLQPLPATPEETP